MVKRCCRNNCEGLFLRNLTIVTHTLNVLIFQKTPVCCNGLCVFSGFSPFACGVPCQLFLSALPVVDEDSPPSCSRHYPPLFPLHWQWQKQQIWLQDHPNLSLCSFPSHTRARPSLRQQKLVSFTVLRNFDEQMTKLLRSHDSFLTLNGMAGGMEKLHWKREGFLQRNWRKLTEKAQGIFTVPKGQAWLLVTQLLVVFQG